MSKSEASADPYIVDKMRFVEAFAAQFADIQTSGITFKEKKSRANDGDLKQRLLLCAL